MIQMIHDYNPGWSKTQDDPQYPIITHDESISAKMSYDDPLWLWPILTQGAITGDQI